MKLLDPSPRWMPWLLFVVASGILGASPRFATAQCELTQVHAQDPRTRARFGYAADISGNLAVIGALGDSQFGTNAGAVHVYRFDPEVPGGAWVLDQKLVAHDATPEDNFGISVAIDDGPPARVVVGAHEDDDNGRDSGSAYIFVNKPPGSDQWVEEAKLIAPDGGPYNLFGCAVAIDGHSAVVGARRKDIGAQNTGASYVYRLNGDEWEFYQQLAASDAEAMDEFGCSVDISLETQSPRIVAGAYFDDDQALNAGAVYVFRLDGETWTEEQKLVASDGSRSDWFGRQVALDNTNDPPRLIGGAWRDEDNGEGAGAAYVFRFQSGKPGAWVEDQKLVASDGEAYDSFGWSVAIKGDDILIGAYSDDDGANFTGSAYVFRHDGTQWSEEMKLHASDAQEPDAFGKAVALSNNLAVIGADQDQDSGLINSGAAYFFGDLDGRGLALVSPTPGAAGKNNQIAAVCGPPASRVYFVFGLLAGSTPVPGCPDLFVDIQNPRIAGSAVADESGYAVISGMVPGALSGQTVLFQAVVPGECGVSNRVAQRFE